MVADAQSWLADPASNYGWVVVGNESADFTAKRFQSREGLAPPELSVTYAPVSTEIPTVSEWGLLLLALALGALAMRRARLA